MKNMYPDSEYFEHLDGLRRSGEWNSVLAPVSLMEAFPDLRAEEARGLQRLAGHLPRAQDPPGAGLVDHGVSVELIEGSRVGLCGHADWGPRKRS